MGACLSCLGLSQPQPHEEPSETERLLYDDPNPSRPDYATLRQHPTRDPILERRQREALQEICNNTARNLIDVQKSSTTPGSNEDRFATLLNTHFGPPPPPPEPLRTSFSPPPSQQHQSSSPDTSHPPSTPDPGRMQEQREPPSPFTQAQINAAAKSAPGLAHVNGNGNGWGSVARAPVKGGSEAAEEDEEEEAWLADVLGAEGEGRWGEIKGGGEPLVVSLDGVGGKGERS